MKVNILDYIDKMQVMYGDKDPSSMAQEPRNMADGGAAKQLLAQPNADGSRAGYATSTVKTKKFKYPISNQFGAFYSDKKPEVSKKIIVQDEKTKFINKLVSDANSGDKHVSIGEIGEKVKKKFKLKNAKSINITSFPSLDLLESRADKIDKVLRDMLIDDKPLNGFWHNVISERTGVPINKPGNLRILEQSPSYNSIKDQGLDLLKVNYSRKSFNYLHDFSLSDQLTKALEISKGNPTYIGLGGEKVRTALPSNKIMEFALRSWNNNKGSKTGPIQFFKNGKPIVWEKGIKLPYKNVSFSYNGQMHKKSNLNTDYMKKFFPEVYNNQIAINNLSVKKIDNPLKPGSKISVKNLIKKIQVDSYGWQPRFPTLEIIHGKKGVISEPFSNLTYGTRDLNQLENAVRTSMKAGNIKPKEGNQLIKTIYSSIQNKTGVDLDQAIIDRQTNLAKNKNLTYPRIKEVGMEQFKKDLLKLAGTVNPKCRKAAVDGGRIGFQDGLSAEICFGEAKKVINKGLRNGFKEGAEAMLATKILQAGKGLKNMVALRNILGPAAIGFTVAAEAGLVGYDMLTTGKSFKAAVGDSLFNYALGDKTKIDTKKERYKGYADAGLDANQIGKISEYENSLDEINNVFAEFGKENELYNAAVTGGPRMSGAVKQKQIKMYNDQVKSNKALIQDLARTQTEDRLNKIDFTGMPLRISEADILRRKNELQKPLPTFYRDAIRGPRYKESLQPILNYPQGTVDTMLTGSINRPFSFARGGLSGGDTSGPPPESGPMSQGLRSLIKNGRKL
jgi:hypothetical protein